MDYPRHCKGGPLLRHDASVHAGFEADLIFYPRFDPLSSVLIAFFLQYICALLGRYWACLHLARRLIRPKYK